MDFLTQATFSHGVGWTVIWKCLGRHSYSAVLSPLNPQPPSQGHDPSNWGSKVSRVEWDWKDPDLNPYRSLWWVCMCFWRVQPLISHSPFFLLQLNLGKCSNWFTWLMYLYVYKTLYPGMFIIKSSTNLMILFIFKINNVLEINHLH